VGNIELKGVCKHFGTVKAVDDVSLSVSDGEFVVLVGPSGCGKTTLLRLIAGLAELNAGEILMDGKLISHLPPGQRNLAMVFQNYALFPHMTVERNLSFGMRLRGIPAAERGQRTQEISRLLHIDDLLKRFPRELSGGQRQRVALGRALMRQPRAFLLDEPLSNLDPALRVEMRAEIIHLHERYPITTVYVTHDQVEAMTMGQRLAVLNEGRLMQVGKPLELYERPDNVFTASFIGSPAMNLVEFDVVSSDDDVSLRSGELGELTLPASALRLQVAIPERVILGVRPEHLRPASDGSPNALSCKVVLVEQLGREEFLHLERNGVSLRCVVTNDFHAVAGDTIHVAPDPEHCYLFDPETEERIAGGGK